MDRGCGGLLGERIRPGEPEPDLGDRLDGDRICDGLAVDWGFPRILGGDKGDQPLASLREANRDGARLGLASDPSWDLHTRLLPSQKTLGYRHSRNPESVTHILLSRFLRKAACGLYPALWSTVSAAGNEEKSRFVVDMYDNDDSNRH